MKESVMSTESNTGDKNYTSTITDINEMDDDDSDIDDKDLK